MDTKNVIAAISLSAAVIILYSLFFQPDPSTVKKNLTEEETKVEKNTDAPTLELDENISEVSRKDALNQSKRVYFENKNIIGSISLVGGTIDDLTFKNYTETLNGEDNVTLLHPRSFSEGYLVETGWATTNKNIDVPNFRTKWDIEGNNKLSPNNPIKLVWENKQNIKFEKLINLDDEYLFTIKQQVINSSDKTYSFYNYGQIIRNKVPKIQNFFILHEGLLGVFDEQLIEKDYDDIEEKKFAINANSGWLGITDKYWLTSLIPSKGKEFKTEFDYSNKVKTNFIETQGNEVSPNQIIKDEIKI